MSKPRPPRRHKKSKNLGSNFNWEEAGVSVPSSQGKGSQHVQREKPPTQSFQCETNGYYVYYHPIHEFSVIKPSPFELMQMKIPSIRQAVGYAMSLDLHISHLFDAFQSRSEAIQPVSEVDWLTKESRADF